ncbi:MAG: choline kinase [Alphaproteobacteria bacterium]|nr:choline kinase [Alphaproteobacteria bacterium]
MTSVEDDLGRVSLLPCWQGSPRIEPLSGGLSNRNYRVRDSSGHWVVRLGGDVPEHGIVRANDFAVSRAAAAAGVAPAVRHAEGDALVIGFIDGRTLTEADVQSERMRHRIVDLLKRAHRGIGRHLRGPAVMFWAFHAVRDYAAQLDGTADGRDLPRLMAIADRLEQAVGPIDLVFGHNDLLPANLIDDGKRLWLIDWEYAGYGSPLFDLGNLASNSRYEDDAWHALLAAYHDRAPDATLLCRADAMRVASLLRESLWALVAKRHRRVAVDFAVYAAEYAGRFESAYRRFVDLHGRSSVAAG